MFLLRASLCAVSFLVSNSPFADAGSDLCFLLPVSVDAIKKRTWISALILRVCVRVTVFVMCLCVTRNFEAFAVCGHMCFSCGAL